MQSLSDVSVRAATAADRTLLARATLDNVNWSGPRFTMSEVESTSELRHYYDGWSDAEDFGLVAENGEGVAVGVVWLRCFTADDPGYGFVAETVHELSIWVSAEHRGRGVGGMLLHRVVEAARSRGASAISLSVEDGNSAARLYERHGFRPALTALTAVCSWHCDAWAVPRSHPATSSGTPSWRGRDTSARLSGLARHPISRRATISCASARP